MLLVQMVMVLMTFLMLAFKLLMIIYLEINLIDGVKWFLNPIRQMSNGMEHLKIKIYHREYLYIQGKNNNLW